tara:strand:- start:268 stop:432 length:165 start_codon:yes stop_codon:yes gene_type:complete
LGEGRRGGDFINAFVQVTDDQRTPDTKMYPTQIRLIADGFKIEATQIIDQTPSL